MIRRLRHQNDSWTDSTMTASRATQVAVPFARHIAREFAQSVSIGAQSGGRGGRSGGHRSTRGEKDSGLLSDDELRAIEAQYADGITAAQVIDIFSSRRIRFSEATFRKYVQQGLLPRSRRVGRKGKHRGSMGVYPAKTVRRVNVIKTLMADNYTIEQIQQQFLRFTNTLETLEESVAEVLSGLEVELQDGMFDAQMRRSMKRELSDIKKTAEELLSRLDGLMQRVASPRTDRYQDTGAAGSAEELL